MAFVIKIRGGKAFGWVKNIEGSQRIIEMWEIRTEVRAAAQAIDAYERLVNSNAGDGSIYPPSGIQYLISGIQP